MRSSNPGDMDLKSALVPTRVPTSRAPFLFSSLLAICLIFGHLGTAYAEGPGPASSATPSIDWTTGPAVGDLGSVAQISIPEGYRFAGKDGAKRVLELAHNPVSEGALGVLIPPQGADEDFFYMTFSFQGVGYVRDDQKNDLHPEAILSTMRAGAEERNKLGQQKGWKPVHLLGWYKEPHYDSHTHDLSWAILSNSEEEPDQLVNYFTRLLGRRGTVSVDLVTEEKSAPHVVPKFDSLIAGFSYKEGEKYAQFRAGDKIASYGLTALIAGGGGAFAAKSGLLPKAWWLIVVGVLALLGALFFVRMQTDPSKRGDHSESDRAAMT